jgi:predicted nucleic acid-binding protein
LSDSNDELALEAAVNGRAHLLVTHSTRDFAGVSRKSKLAVVTPQQFLQGFQL